jgi:hypothetical protein
LVTTYIPSGNSPTYEARRDKYPDLRRLFSDPRGCTELSPVSFWSPPRGRIACLRGETLPTGRRRGRIRSRGVDVSDGQCARGQDAAGRARTAPANRAWDRPGFGWSSHVSRSVLRPALDPAGGPRRPSGPCPRRCPRGSCLWSHARTARSRRRLQGPPRQPGRTLRRRRRRRAGTG